VAVACSPVFLLFFIKRYEVAVVRKKHPENPLQHERKEFERLFIRLDTEWSKETEQEIIALVGGLKSKDHDVQVRQAERLLRVLAKYGRREQMVIVARLLSFSARRRLHKQLIKEGKIKEAAETARHFDLSVLPDDLEAALWPNKKTKLRKEDIGHLLRPLTPPSAVLVSDDEPTTPFSRDLVRLKVFFRRTVQKTITFCVHIKNTLIS